MAFFNRKLYRQKPRIYGPVSQVQASIFANAERAGIPIPTLMLPAWNTGSDIYSLGKNLKTISKPANISYYENGIYFPRGTDYLHFNVSADEYISGKGTMFCVTDWVEEDATRYLYFMYGVGGEYDYQYVLYDQTTLSTVKNFALRLSTKNTAYNFYSTGIIVQELHSWFACADRPNAYNKLSISGAIFYTNAETATYSSDGKGLTVRGNGIISNLACKIGLFVYWKEALASNNIDALLHDNPYFLLHRQAPVFYSVPTSGEGSSVTATAELDALLQRTGITSSVSLGALLQETKSTTVSIGSLLQTAKTSTVDIDAILQALKGSTISIDAFLQIVEIAEIDVDVLLQSIFESAIDIDAFLQEVATSQAFVDALKQAIKSKTIDTNAILQAGKSVGISIDGSLSKYGVGSINVSLDSLLQESKTKTTDIDALIALIGESITTDIGALLRATKLGVVSLDAILVTEGVGIAQTGLSGLIQAVKDGELSVDAMLQKSKLSTIEINAVLSTLEISTVSIDALLNKAPSNMVLMDALIQSTRNETISVGALLSTTSSAGIDVDAILYLIATAGVDFNAIIQKIYGSTISLSAILGALSIVVRSTISAQSREFTIPAQGRELTITSRS